MPVFSPTSAPSVAENPQHCVTSMPTLPDLLAVHEQSAGATLARTAPVIEKVEHDGRLAGGVSRLSDRTVNLFRPKKL